MPLIAVFVSFCLVLLVVGMAIGWFLRGGQVEALKQEIKRRAADDRSTKSIGHVPQRSAVSCK